MSVRSSVFAFVATAGVAFYFIKNAQVETCQPADKHLQMCSIEATVAGGQSLGKGRSNAQIEAVTIDTFKSCYTNACLGSGEMPAMCDKRQYAALQSFRQKSFQELGCK